MIDKSYIKAVLCEIKHGIDSFNKESAPLRAEYPPEVIIEYDGIRIAVPFSMVDDEVIEADKSDALIDEWKQFFPIKVKYEDRDEPEIIHSPRWLRTGVTFLAIATNESNDEVTK